MLQNTIFPAPFFMRLFIVFPRLITAAFPRFPNSLMSFADHYLITFTISMLYSYWRYWLCGADGYQACPTLENIKRQ